MSDNNEVVATKTISAKKTGGEAVTVNFDLPADLDGLKDKFGDEYVAGAAHGAITITVQALMRRLIEAGKSPEEIQEAVSNWVPGERSAAIKQTALQKATSALGKMTPEEKAELLAKLTA